MIISGNIKNVPYKYNTRKKTVIIHILLGKPKVPSEE